jgi:hypothetical protein
MSVEELQVEPAEPVGVGDQVDLDELPAARDREAEDDPRPSVLSPHEPRDSIHECQPGRPGPSREGLGHSRRTMDLTRGAREHRRVVGSEHDLGI